MFDDASTSSSERLARLTEAAGRRYEEHVHEVSRRADLIFGWLMLAQWTGGVAAAVYISPLTWIGATSSVHVHLLAAILLGGVICLVPSAMAFLNPGAVSNRYFISISQAMFSALLIHLTGGRIETHFHIFGVLAFLALYRDWRVLIPATVVVAADHMVRGIFWPESVFGIASAESWRWLEHGAWVAFEVAILSFACVQSSKEMKQMAIQWARLSINQEIIESEVDRQTQEIRVAQDAMRESESRLRSVIESANDAFIAMDENGRIVEWSERATELFKWSADEAISKPLAMILGSESTCKLFAEDPRSDLNLPRRARFECVAKNRLDEEIPVEVSASSTNQADKLRFNIFIQNISERKAMQTRLVHAEKMEGIGQLAAGIAHEINTPTQFTSDNISFIETSFEDIRQLLNHVDSVHTATAPDSDAAKLWSGFEECAREIDLPYLLEEVPLAIVQSRDGVRRIAEITSAMKSFSHPGTAGEKTPVDLSRAVQDAVTVCRNEWKHVAKLKMSLDPKLTAVPAYPSELNQVLLNLIVNAAHAIGDIAKVENPNGRICITTFEADGHAVIRVQDNGPGMTKALQRKIFEPFFTTKAVGKGTGQGLAIAHAVIVEKHGGQLEVESEVGKGATFIVRLPLSQPQRNGAEQYSEEETHSVGV